MKTDDFADARSLTTPPPAHLQRGIDHRMLRAKSKFENVRLPDLTSPLCANVRLPDLPPPLCSPCLCGFARRHLICRSNFADITGAGLAQHGLCSLERFLKVRGMAVEADVAWVVHPAGSFGESWGDVAPVRLCRENNDVV